VELLIAESELLNNDRQSLTSSPPKPPPSLNLKICQELLRSWGGDLQFYQLQGVSGADQKEYRYSSRLLLPLATWASPFGMENPSIAFWPRGSTNMSDRIFSLKVEKSEGWRLKGRKVGRLKVITCNLHALPTFNLLSSLRLTLRLELEQGVNDIAADVDHHLQERFISLLLVLNQRVFLPIAA